MRHAALGALGVAFGGPIAVYRDRKRAIRGKRWLRFWQGRLGEWTIRIAGLGLRPLPGFRRPRSP